jgi:type IV secretory pathway ATPase VirB11/archaellum biosynthesis ATPase
MLNADPNFIARKVLSKLIERLAGDDLEELVINSPGEVWVKRRRGEWQKSDAPDLDYEYLFRSCKVLAHINGARFSEDDLPVVSCELPGMAFRFQAIMGANVRYNLDDRKGAALAIRALTADTSINFDSYGFSAGAALPGAAAGLVEFEMGHDHIEALRQVIARHESIIISGATATGKTTFTNKLIELVPMDHRVITVEDARELTVPHLNRVHLMVPRNRSANSVDYRTIIDSLVRLTPDWIICGELSIANAAPIYSTMGKGHPVITTVHAGSPSEAVAAFMNNMSMAGGAEGMMSGAAMLESIRSQIGAIIQLERRDGRRRVVEVAFPSREVARERLEKEAREKEKAE